MAIQRKLRNILVIGLSLTTIIPFLVVVYLLNYGLAAVASSPVIVVITLLLACLGVYLLLNISNAISKISNDADTIAQGRLIPEIRPAAEDNKEIVSLASSLTSITRQLVGNLDELERRAILLERANKELENMSNRKTEFISIVSHELRSPLINMKQSIALFLDNQLGDVTPDQKKYLTLITRNIDRLICLVGELLDLSAIDFGRLKVIKREEDLKNIINESVNTVDRWRESKGVKLELNFPEHMPLVYLDAHKMVQVFINLLSNAIKYNSPGGRIKVLVNFVEKQIQATAGGDKKLFSPKEKFVEISVADTGRGIAKEDLDKIFERFTKVGKPAQADSYSSGLGLAIAKEIVKLHGGEIKVESKIDKGSTFTVCLPLSQKEAAVLM